MTLLIAGGILARATTQFVLLFAFARFGGTVMTGLFAYTLALSAPLFAAGELSLRIVYQTQQRELAFRLYFVLRCAGVILAATAAIGVFTTQSRDALLIGIWVAVMKGGDSLSDIVQAFYLRRQRRGAAASINWVNASLSGSGILVALLITNNPVVALAVSALVSLLIGILTAIRPWRDKSVAHAARSRRALIATVRAGVPLAIGQAAVSLLAYAPVLYLGTSGGASVAGVFAATQYFVTFATILFASVHQSYLSSTNPKLIVGVPVPHILLWGAGLVGGLTVAWTLPKLLVVIYGPEFRVSYTVAILVGLAISCLGMEYSATYSALRRRLYQAPARSGLSALLVLLSYILLWRPAATTETAALMVLLAMAARACYMWLAHVRSSTPRTRR